MQREIDKHRLFYFRHAWQLSLCEAVFNFLLVLLYGTTSKSIFDSNAHVINITVIGSWCIFSMKYWLPDVCPVTSIWIYASICVKTEVAEFTRFYYCGVEIISMAYLITRLLIQSPKSGRKILPFFGSICIYTVVPKYAFTCLSELIKIVNCRGKFIILALLITGRYSFPCSLEATVDS